MVSLSSSQKPTECDQKDCSQEAKHMVYYSDPDETLPFCLGHALHKYRKNPNAEKVVSGVDSSEIERH